MHPRQQDLPLPRPRTPGARRKRAGRPPAPGLRRVAHRVRPRVSGRAPLHVTLRVAPQVRWLRRLDAFRAVRRALALATRRQAFRICHISIQRNHLHLIVEADDRLALARGLQGFSISCARQLNRLGGRAGRVFDGRYHAEELGSPRRVRSAIAYVLNNWRRHGQDQGRREALDPYASGMGFDGWATPLSTRLRPDAEILPVAFPTTWLLSTGWRRHRLIGLDEVPGPRS